MKNSIKRAQSRAGSSFAERENQRSLAGGKSNFRPKVKQLKKTLLTLVALLAVTTGAWATDVITVTWNPSDIVPEHTSDDSFTKDGITITAATCDFRILTFGGGGTFTTTLGNFTKIEISADFTGNVSGTGWSNDGWQSATWTGNAASVSFSGDIWGGGMTCDGGNLTIVFTIEESPAIKVAWNGETKTGTFTMPGGNVTLEPEYYPQATVADGAVTAADADARATTDDPLVKVDATKLTGAKKLMYFVSNSGTTAPAYDAEGWTDQLPTAEGFTQQGIVYVWYYPVGTDEGQDGATATYSDGDICLQSITARIAAAPTYAVTFADDTAEPTLWTAEPNAGVKKGQTVTVTYTGTRKVIGVKAEKKAAASAAANVVTGTVNVETLKVGDIIRNATGATGNVNAIMLKKGRYKMGGSEMEDGFSLSVSQFNDFDADGYTIKGAWGNFTPVDENGQDGNAWIVLDFDSKGPVIGGYTVEPTN